MIKRSDSFKIIHVTNVHPRFDVRIYQKQCYSLSKEGIAEVELLVADGKGNQLTKNFLIRDCGKPKGGRIGRIVFGLFHVFRAIRMQDPNVIHFHDPELIPIGLLLKLLGYTVIYDAHEDLPRQILGKEWIYIPFRRPVAFISSIIEWLAGIVFDYICTATKKIAERFPPDKTVVVQNFPFAEEMQSADFIPYLNRPLTIAYTGGITYIRGAKQMIESMGCLSIDCPAVLELAGLIYPNSILDELKRLNGWERVRYHGFLDRSDLSKLLCRARAGLVLFHPLPNHIDSQPNKMFEYMAFGLPIIASNFPAWREFIECTGSGICVNPLDISEIADAIQWIMENPEEAELMGNRGRKAVIESINWEVESKKLIDTYYKILMKSNLEKSL